MQLRDQLPELQLFFQDYKVLEGRDVDVEELYEQHFAPTRRGILKCAEGRPGKGDEG